MKVKLADLRLAFTADDEIGSHCLATQQAGLVLYIALRDGEIEVCDALALLNKSPAAMYVLLDSVLTSDSLADAQQAVSKRISTTACADEALTMTYLMAWAARARIFAIACATNTAPKDLVCEEDTTTKIPLPQPPTSPTLAFRSR